MLCDALVNPVDFIVTAGQVADCTQAVQLLSGHAPRQVLADKGYDTDAILGAIKDCGAEPVIPPKSNRKIQREYDKALYKERNLIERFFSKLKHYRRIATRYEKNLSNFKSLIALACAAIILA